MSCTDWSFLVIPLMTMVVGAIWVAMMIIHKKWGDE